MIASSRSRSQIKCAEPPKKESDGSGEVREAFGFQHRARRDHLFLLGQREGGQQMICPAGRATFGVTLEINEGLIGLVLQHGDRRRQR